MKRPDKRSAATLVADLQIMVQFCWRLLLVYLKLTVLGTDQRGVRGLRWFADVNSGFGDNPKLILQVPLQVADCILLFGDILAAGVAAYPRVSWHSHGFNIVTNDFAASVVLGTGPDQRHRVFGNIQYLRLTRSVCEMTKGI